MLALDDLDLLDAEIFGEEDTALGEEPRSQASRVKLEVDRTWREGDWHLLHAQGEGASLFVPGGSLYTPDGIIWDVASIDAGGKGLTVRKKRSEVSLTAWLTGDWSSLTGSVPVKPPMWAREAAMSARETAYDVKEGAKKAASSFTKYIPWIIGGVVVIGVGSIAAPVVAPLLARRALR